MTPYPISAIKIAENRQRQEFNPDAHEELKQSIEGQRLLHAIVVRDSAVGPVLVAGERRLRAISDIFELGGNFSYDGVLYTDTVPTVNLGELSSLEAEEAELDENLKRKDLTWKEHAAAVKRLHELRKKQKLEEVGLGNGDDSPSIAMIGETLHTVADTAVEVRKSSEGSFQDITRKEILVARHLHKPEIAKAKSLDEAWKILKAQDKRAENQALAAEVGRTFTASLHQLYNADCITWMRAAIPLGQQYDVILTDPPYGMGADSFGDGGGKLQGIEHHYKDTPEHWRKLMFDWTQLSYKIAKPQAHAYVFCDLDRFHELKQMMELAGWYVFRTPLIDYKVNSGRVPLPDRGPRRCWEMILYAIKGDKPVTHIYPDVIQCTADENMTHGAQKPVSLYQNLLMRSVKPGDLILDTFAGSGTIFPAAHAMQCVATGVEQEAEYYGMCLKRLQQLKETADPLSGLLDLP